MGHPFKPVFESMFQTLDFLFVLFYFFSIGNGIGMIPQDIKIALLVSFYCIMIIFWRLTTLQESWSLRRENNLQCDGSNRAWFETGSRYDYIVVHVDNFYSQSFAVRRYTFKINHRIIISRKKNIQGSLKENFSWQNKFLHIFDIFYFIYSRILDKLI